MMAGSDQVDIVFRGVGGHGSMPQLAKDPVVMAALAIVEFQTIISRMIPPPETAVPTVGSVQAGSAHNVIPDQALLKANLRLFNAHTGATDRRDQGCLRRRRAHLRDARGSASRGHACRWLPTAGQRREPVRPPGCGAGQGDRAGPCRGPGCRR